jgi:hypothetical protein
MSILVLLNENIEETIPVSIKSEAQGFDIDEGKPDKFKRSQPTLQISLFVVHIL